MANSPVPTPTVSNKQLYNGGSEWQNDYGYLPDYQQTFYRNYDAAIGRFIGVDPMAESAESMTTYQYAGNNPIMYNDPMGNLLRYVQPPSYYSLQSNTQLGPGGNMGDDFDDDASYNEYAYGGGYDQGGGSGGDPNVDGSSYYGNTSALDGGDYSQQWTRILSGSGISLNANGGAYISSTRSALAYPLNTSAGTVLLKFTGDGQLTSYSVDPAPGPHGLIATEDGVTITLLQTLINLSPQIDVENSLEGLDASDLLGFANERVHDVAEYSATGPMSSAAQWAKWTEGFGYLFMVNDVRKGYVLDNHHLGNHTQNALQHVAGTALGAAYGASFGSTAGAILGGGIGTFIGGPIGTGAGAYIGAWAGGIIGAWAGGWAGGKIADMADQ